MAVAFVDITESLQASGSGPYGSHTFSHTVPAGSDRVLVVIVRGLKNTGNPALSISSVVFNTSETLTAGITQTFQGGPARGIIAIYTLFGATVTTANVVVTFGATDSDSTACHAVNYTGTNAVGAAAGTNGNDSSPTHSITTLENNSMIVAGVAFRGADGEPWSPSNSETERADGESGTSTSSDLSFWAAELLKATAGAQTIGATGGANDRWGTALLELKEASAATNVDAGVVNLLLPEQAATLKTDVSLTASAATVGLSAFSPNLATDISFTAGTDSIVLTAQGAEVKLGVIIDALTQALALTVPSATVLTDISFTASSAGLTIATQQATVTLGIQINATSVAVSISPQSASLNIQIAVAAALQSISLSGLSTSLNIAMLIASQTASIRLSPLNATVQEGVGGGGRAWMMGWDEYGRGNWWAGG